MQYWFFQLSNPIYSLESIKGYFVFPAIRFNDQGKTTFYIKNQMPGSLVFKLKNMKGAKTPNTQTDTNNLVNPKLNSFKFQF